MICNKKCNYKDPELIIKTCFVEIQSAHPLSRKIVTPLSGAAHQHSPANLKILPPSLNRTPSPASRSSDMPQHQAIIEATSFDSYTL
jgi:hypothetical protein